MRKPWGSSAPAEPTDLRLDDPSTAGELASRPGTGEESEADRNVRRVVGDALVRFAGAGEVAPVAAEAGGPGEKDASQKDAEGGSGGRLDHVRQLVLAVAGAARGVGARALAGGKWLADTLIDVAPRLPVRTAERLREHHPGKTTDEIATELVSAAVKASMAVGVAGGALAAVEFAAPPTLLAAPAQLAAETLAVAVIEIKLVAELHELYGLRAEGAAADRGVAYLMAWTNQKGIDPLNPKSVVSGLGAAAKRQIRRRVVGRFGRNIFTLGPMLTGAVIGGAMNRHETRDLGHKILADLRVASAWRNAKNPRR